MKGLMAQLAALGLPTEDAASVIPFRRRGDEIIGPEMGRPAYSGGGQVTGIRSNVNRYAERYKEVGDQLNKLHKKKVDPTSPEVRNLLQERRFLAEKLIQKDNSLDARIRSGNVDAGD